MGDFAVNVAKGYQVGTERGIFSILSAMGISRDEFFSHIGRSISFKGDRRSGSVWMLG